ncbi:MAG: hypothetical protein RQ875_09515 [Vicingaceae bacterium]|nr:hypothetical protein [Vicingaceae bacterium]
MQNWKDLYTELANIITTKVPAIKWVDLWHNQINFIENEYPFPVPAVFLAFRSNNITDQGLKVQQLTLQIDVFLYYETFADTFTGSTNQTDALAFLDAFDSLNKALHASSGTNYSSMRRIAFGPVDTGGAGNLYQVIYECLLTDYSVEAHNKPTTDLTDNPLDVQEGTPPISGEVPLFTI